MAMINLGMVLQEKRGLKEAAELFRGAIKLDPQNPMGLSNLGQILLELGHLDDLDEAEALCLKAIQMTPDRPHPVNNLGNVYRAMGRFEEAVECYQKAMALAPGMPMPLNNMAQALQGRGRYDESMEYYLQAIAIEPLSPRFHANYASLLNDQDDHEKAIERYRYVLGIDPQHAESYTGMGQAYLQLQETDLAEAAFLKSLEIDSELTAPRLALGNLYAEMGEFERADEAYAEVLKVHPKCVEIYYQRATHQKGRISQDDFDQMVWLTSEKYLGDAGRAQLHFGLATIYDQKKDFEHAATNLKLANELQQSAKMKKNETYDPDNFTQWIDQIIQAFSPDLIRSLKNAGSESTRPIFVVGLPRSGTTLTEQILASHSAVFGAGELTVVNDVFEKLRKSRGDVMVNPVDVARFLDSGVLKQSADDVLGFFDRKDNGHARIVDKMPD
ncbi:MAG: tetratricopeptide repeat protein, partial [Isosphaeraceae bacterium]